MSPRRAPDWLTAWEYAHRGLHSAGVAENSRAAAESAIAAGMGIECDIQMSRDNVPLVFHDWELDRLTSQRGQIAARPADELCQIALLETADTIWRLTDLLELVAGRVPILIEVKSHPAFALPQACIAIARGGLVPGTYPPPATSRPQLVGENFAVVAGHPLVSMWR